MLFRSCHAYYFDRSHKTRTAASMQDFLASSEDMTKFIATVSDAADQAREANNGTKDIALSFDEWGVWYSDKWNEQEDQWKAEAAQGLHHEPWPKSPHLLEDIYTAADAVVEGSLVCKLNHSVHKAQYTSTCLSDRKSTRLNSSHSRASRMPSSA